MDATQIGFIVVVVVGITEAIKYAGLSSRWSPLIAVVLGLGMAFFYEGFNFLATAAGVILGLATTGGYAVVKSSILNK